MTGSSSIASHGERPGDGDAVQLRPADLDVADRLHPAGRGAPPRCTASAPIASSTVRMPVRPGLSANPGAAHAPARARRSQRQEERRRAEVTGDAQTEWLAAAPAEWSPRAPL